MKDHKTAAAIYSIAAVICYLAAIIGIIRESSFGIVFLCFGSMFLCFSSARKLKEKNSGSEDSDPTVPNEEPQNIQQLQGIKREGLVMFRDIRRKKKEISQETAKQLLETERRGVLSVQGDDDYPYAVPINYLYREDEGKIYFHGSAAGHKAESIRKNDKVCFTVYGNQTVKDEDWAPYVQSVVVFGRCHMIEDRNTAIELVREFAAKYYPDAALVEEEISKSGQAVRMYEIAIEHLSGKEIQER